MKGNILTHIPKFLLICCFLLQIFILSFILGTSFFSKDTKIRQSGISIVLDVSLSMQVRDVPYISRLETAKLLIEEISYLSDLPIGLSIFSGDAQKLTPFTLEREFLLSVLPSLDEKNIFLQGSNIKGGLESGISQFDSDISRGTLILLSDGGEGIGDNFEEIKQTAIKKGIDIILVGVGTKKGGNIVLGTDSFGREIYKVFQGKKVISVLEEQNLRTIAAQVGGKYITPEEFEKTLKSIFYSVSSSTQKQDIYLFLCSFFFWIGYLCFFTFLKISPQRRGK